jgi:hypothetical protein
MQKTFVIRCVANNKCDDDKAESQFWSNEYGWTDFRSATKFTDKDTETLDLPMDGKWVRVARRFEDALEIQDGAINPVAIAKALVDACLECIDEGVSQCEDPAVRLIVHQLSHIVDSRTVDTDFVTYSRLIRFCEENETGHVFVPR